MLMIIGKRWVCIPASQVTMVMINLVLAYSLYINNACYFMNDTNIITKYLPISSPIYQYTFISSYMRVSVTYFLRIFFGFYMWIITRYSMYIHGHICNTSHGYFFLGQRWRPCGFVIRKKSLLVACAELDEERSYVKLSGRSISFGLDEHWLHLVDCLEL